MEITTEEIENSDSLLKLQDLVSHCERCDAVQTKNKDVFSDGAGSAKVVFIGEATGKDEDLQGKPFVVERDNF
jgi:DNA polymerase